MGKQLNKVVLTILTTVTILFFVILSIGGGHGTYLLAKIVYPYAMFLAIIHKDSIGFLEIVLAIVQVPIYFFITYKRPKFLYAIVLLHIVVAVICLNLSTETF